MTTSGMDDARRELALYCFVCRRRRATDRSISQCTVEEGGITSHSLHNAHVLLDDYGLPDEVYYGMIPPPNYEYEVHLLWNAGTAPHGFTLTGFSWGYPGEGPRGFSTFLSALGIPGRDIRDWSQSRCGTFRRMPDGTYQEIRHEPR